MLHKSYIIFYDIILLHTAFLPVIGCFERRDDNLSFSWHFCFGSVGNLDDSRRSFRVVSMRFFMLADARIGRVARVFMDCFT